MHLLLDGLNSSNYPPLRENAHSPLLLSIKPHIATNNLVFDYLLPVLVRSLQLLHLEILLGDEVLRGGNDQQVCQLLKPPNVEQPFLHPRHLDERGCVLGFSISLDCQDRYATLPRANVGVILHHP